MHNVIYNLHNRYILHIGSRAVAEKNERMKVARTAAGLSQQELADAVGATRQTIGLIEAGRYNPSLKLCTAICKALGATLDGLFWEGDEPCI